VLAQFPFAGRCLEPDILPMMAAPDAAGRGDGEDALLAAMALQPEDIQSDGKGAIIGSAGELEHWCAVACARRLCDARAAGLEGPGPARHRAGRPVGGNALAIVPSTKKVGGPGRASWTCPSRTSTRATCAATSMRWRSACPAHRAADELVYVLAMSNGARIHERVGGLREDEIARWDGQR
jgi:hypothetical protein